jgi:hypothetical protein
MVMCGEKCSCTTCKVQKMTFNDIIREMSKQEYEISQLSKLNNILLKKLGLLDQYIFIFSDYNMTDYYKYVEKYNINEKSFYDVCNNVKTNKDSQEFIDGDNAYIIMYME